MTSPQPPHIRTVLAALLLSASTVQAQRFVANTSGPRQAPHAVTGTISGRVTDATNGQAVPAAQISIDGTSLGNVADDAGRYTITGVPAGDRRVTARRVGYAPLTLSATVRDGGSATLDFALPRAAVSLTEVVTTVTGQQERFKVGNAIATMAPDSILRAAPVTSMSELLDGRVPGLQVYFSGGFSGVASPVRIRGTNSFALSNDPIFVIDGVRVESSLGSQVSLGVRPGRLSDISPYEIESIDVVKGPSAATLYGSDAANGVIVIRTKRGSASPPQWRTWTEQGTIEAAEHYNPNWYGYGTNLTTGAAQRCLIVQVVAKVCRQDSVVTWNPFEDKATSPMATGYRHVYGAQVRGGVQNFSYFLSGETTDETGYLRMPDAEEERLKAQRGVTSLPDWQLRPNQIQVTNLRANLGSSIGERAHVQLSNGLVFNSSAIPQLFFISGGVGNGSPPTTNGGWTFGNRPGDQFSLKSAENTTRYTGSVSGTYDPSGWLSTRGTAGFDWSSVILDQLQKNGEGPTTTIAGQRIDNRYDIKVQSVDLSATANRNVRANLTSRTSVGAQYNRRREYNALATGTNLAPGAVTLSGAATTTSSEATTETIIAGTYAEQTFAFRERLFVNGAIRLDGGSAFGADFSTAAYPKASLSWLAADGRQTWATWVDNLRLRLAWGSSGVQPSAVAALQRDCLSSSIVNGVAVTGATLCQLGNAHLKPETQTETEAGVDADFFGSRGRLELTLYKRQSRDAITNLSTGASVGALSYPVNLGAVRNRGIEALISARLIDRPVATVDLSLNADLNENRVLSVGPGIPLTPNALNKPGYPLNSRWVLGYTYADADGNGIITSNEVQVDTGYTWVGAMRPQHSGSGTATIGLFRQALRLSALADYRGQFIIVNATEGNQCIFNSCRAAYDPTAPLDRQAATQAVVKTASITRSGGFDYNGRFVRLREVSATWAIPSRFAQRVGFTGAQLGLSGRNVAVFTKYPGFSVESPQSIPSSDSYNVGNPAAPMARYWILRLTLDR